MEYDRLPLINDSSVEFRKMLSISVLERGVILVVMIICEDSELKYMFQKYSFSWCKRSMLKSPKKIIFLFSRESLSKRG